MVDFCWKCLAEEIHPEQPERNDFHGLVTEPDVATVLCEGCGVITVDHEGRPVDLNLGPWIASFRDGPCAAHDHDRVWAVGPILRDLYLARHPMRPLEWILVGYEGMVPESPWPSQVHYRLGGLVTMAGADGEPVAYYDLVSDD